MLVYRARLEPGVQAVLSASLRPWGALPGSHMRRLRATVRYVLAGGAVRTHRGWMAAATTDGAPLALTAWQLEGDGALLTFRNLLPTRPADRGLALTDRFVLPLSLEAWGVTALASAQISVTSACRAAGQTLRLRGVVTVCLRTAAADYPIRIPFCRTVGVPTGLQWTAHGGVTALRWRVDEGGRISGEVGLTFRYEGRPSGSAPSLQDLQRIRELAGRVLSVEAEHAGDGQAVVRGSLELELWWLDREGRSRMLDRRVRFSTLLAIPGAGAADRLEARARLERLTPLERPGAVEAQGMLSVSVTALRDEAVLLGGAPYRLPRVTAAGTATILLTEGLMAAPEPHRPAAAEALLLLPRLEGDWQKAMALELPRPEAMALAAISEDGVQVRSRRVTGSPLPERSLRFGHHSAEAAIPLPGPVRQVLDVQAYPLTALVQREGGGLQVLTARAALPLKVETLLACALSHELRVWVT